MLFLRLKDNTIDLIKGYRLSARRTTHNSDVQCDQNGETRGFVARLFNSKGDPQRNTLVIYMLGQKEIKALDLSLLRHAFKTCMKNWVSRKQLEPIHFGISGYDSDPRALFDIPEVRGWAEALHREMPYLVSFVDRETLHWLLPAIAPIEVVGREQGQTAWKLDPDKGSAFLERVVGSSNKVFQTMASTQEEFDQLVDSQVNRLRSLLR